MHLRLVPRAEEPAGCIPCAGGCGEDGAFRWCACDCHLTVLRQQLVLTEAALRRAQLRLAGQRLVRLIK